MAVYQQLVLVAIELKRLPRRRRLGHTNVCLPIYLRWEVGIGEILYSRVRFDHSSVPHRTCGSG